MSEVRITVNTSGVAVERQLQGWLDIMSGGGRRRILENIADTVLRITWENFGESGAHRPHGWPPLSQKYQKAIGYFGPPKLILSGDLISSVRTLELSDDHVAVGSDLEYAALHQFGEEIVPARPYFPFYSNPVGEAEMTPFCEERVNQAVERTVRQITGQEPSANP